MKSSRKLQDFPGYSIECGVPKNASYYPHFVSSKTPDSCLVPMSPLFGNVWKKSSEYTYILCRGMAERAHRSHTFLAQTAPPPSSSAVFGAYRSPWDFASAKRSFSKSAASSPGKHPTPRGPVPGPMPEETGGNPRRTPLVFSSVSIPAEQMCFPDATA